MFSTGDCKKLMRLFWTIDAVAPRDFFILDAGYKYEILYNYLTIQRALGYITHRQLRLD